MRTQALMFKEMLVNMGVYMPIDIPELHVIELPYIPPILNFSKIYGSYDSALPTYQNLHHRH